MKLIYKVLGLAVIDFLLFAFWVSQMDFGGFVNFIGFLVYIPFVFFVNIIIGIILYFTKQNGHTKLFLINAVISAVIMYFVYADGMERYKESSRLFEDFEMDFSGLELEIDLDLPNLGNNTKTDSLNNDTIK